MAGLMEGKRGLVMGVANDHSIAWGCAKVLHAQGAQLAFTYQGEQFGRRVTPLAESLGSTLMLPADVQDEASMDAACAALAEAWGGLDFVIHAIAYSDKSELQGQFADTSRANFLNSLDISCYSLIDVARRVAPMMREGGSIVTMSYLGAQRVMPNYNVMGVAKAALEASVRYLANDLGPQGIRVNALSPGPMRTLAGSAVGGARRVYKTVGDNAPMRANATLDHVGGAAMWLCSDYGASTTGEVLFVDGGYHAIGMAQLENLTPVQG
ncbi:MAG: enoyl-ACP reductase [Pseudomonadota bacterium]